MGGANDQCKKGKGPKQGNRTTEVGVYAQVCAGRAGEKASGQPGGAWASVVLVGCGPQRFFTCLRPSSFPFCPASSSFLACLSLVGG